MSNLEDEQENFRRLKKLVFQVGLPLIRELFVERYIQNHGDWDDTPEFGEKLLKILDGQGQNNSKETETRKKSEERQRIQSGKSSKWDYTILHFILTHLNFQGASTSKRVTEKENQMVHNLTQVRNKLAHDYLAEEKMPWKEFKKLWKKSYDACFYLGAETEVMDNIMKLHQNHNKNFNSGQGQMLIPEGAGGHQNFVYSSLSSPQSTKEINTITTNANISTAAASQNNSVVSKIEDKNKVVVSAPLPSKPIISPIHRKPIVCTVKPSIQNARPEIFRPISSPQTTATAIRNYVQPITFSSPSANSFSTTTATTSGNRSTQQFGVHRISSPATFSRPRESSRTPLLSSAYQFSNYRTSNMPGNQNTQNIPLPNRRAEVQTGKTVFPQVWLFYTFLHGIFLLVISSLFLSRLMHFSADIPNLDWMIFTIIAVCLGALRIILSICCFFVMRPNDSNVRSPFGNIFGFIHVFIIILLGVLALCFLVKNLNYPKFWDWNDEEGGENVILYVCMISALSIEPVLFALFVLFGALAVCCYCTRVNGNIFDYMHLLCEDVTRFVSQVVMPFVHYVCRSTGRRLVCMIKQAKCFAFMLTCILYFCVSLYHFILFVICVCLLFAIYGGEESDYHTSLFSGLSEALSFN